MKHIFAQLSNRFSYGFAVAVFSVLGGQASATIGLLFVILIAQLPARRLWLQVGLIGGGVLVATLLHYTLFGMLRPWSRRWELPALRQVNDWIVDLKVSADIPTDELERLARRLEQLPTLNLRLSGLLSGAVVLAGVSGELVTGTPSGAARIFFGGAISIVLYVIFATLVAEILIRPALNQARRLLAARNAWFGPSQQTTLAVKLGLFILLIAISLAVVFSLFILRPDLIQSPGNALLVSLVILGTAVFMAILILYSIVRPLHEIEKAATHLITAQTARFFSGSTNRELIALAEHFYTAAQQIIDYRRELQELNRLLERRVAERTTELEAQKEALRKSEQRLSLHVQQTPLAVIEWNVNFEVVEWNPSAERIFGYSRQETLGRSALELIVPASIHEQVRWVWNDLLTKKGGERSTNENVTQDGRSIICEWYNTVLVDPEGNVIGVTSLARDITQRVQAENALRESQHQLEELYQSEQERRQLSDTLREVARIVSSTLEQEKVLSLILAQLENVLTCHHASVTLLSDGQLAQVAEWSKGGKLESSVISVDQYPLNAETLREKKPIVVPDVRRDERWQQTTRTNAIHSFINAPLLVHGRPIGLLGVGRHDRAAYSAKDAEIVFAFASQVAIAIENARLVEQTQQALDETEGLFKAARAILGATQLPELCQHLVRRLNDLVGAERTTLFLVDHERQEITLRLGHGSIDHDPDLLYDELTEGICGFVFRSRQPILSLQAEDAIESATMRAWRQAHDVGTMIVVPLITRGAVDGVIVAASSAHHPPFTMHDVDLLMALAAQAATAIANIRLYERSEQLLLNILPEPIAERLKKGERIIADSFAEATVLFADIVGSTTLGAQMTAGELVNLLNDLFSTFDRLTAQYGLEKIKTIGDSYMVVGGLPTPRADHAEAIAEMALDMQKAVADYNHSHRQAIRLRIGIHTGPVTAGVIGSTKFTYDLWGATVNTASHMESHGVPDKIQVTEATYRQLQDKYTFEPRGTIPVKGQGDMATYFLLARLVAQNWANTR
ncbi:MAG: GAF domain-containing protein [Anaerolineae bacterium]|nr:GAF domain-containing protein [Anaerolineae bacterium]